MWNFPNGNFCWFRVGRNSTSPTFKFNFCSSHSHHPKKKQKTHPTKDWECSCCVWRRQQWPLATSWRSKDERLFFHMSKTSYVAIFCFDCVWLICFFLHLLSGAVRFTTRSKPETVETFRIFGDVEISIHPGGRRFWRFFFCGLELQSSWVN